MRPTGIESYTHVVLTIAAALCWLAACVGQDTPSTTKTTDASETTETSGAPDGATSSDGTGVSTDPGTTDAHSTSTTAMQSSSSDAASTGELQPAPECGDGVVDPETEECDDGTYNDDHGSCTGSCKLNVCGDMLQHDGVEACDLGLANGDGSQCGGCVAGTCELGPHCGDNHKDDACGELCDGDDSPSGLACTPTCRYDGARIVFITPGTYLGDLTAYTERQVEDGVDAADWICHDLADAAGLIDPPADDNNEPPSIPRFRAWISSQGKPVSGRFATDYAGLYVTRGGTTIAEGWDGLTGTLLAPITEGPNGEQLLNKLVWTNTLTNGDVNDVSLSCINWMAGMDSDGAVGYSGSVEYWTFIPGEDGVQTCGLKRHLYCVQQ